MSGLSEDIVLVWRISPDPTGASDSLVVDSAEQAGQIVTEAAEEALGATRNGQEPQTYTIDCRYMPRTVFAALCDEVLDVED